MERKLVPESGVCFMPSGWTLSEPKWGRGGEHGVVETIFELLVQFGSLSSWPSLGIV